MGLDEAAAVRTSGLTRDYGAGRGLFDLDIEVGAGEVFGYLGPNGAGKTTTIRLLMGLARPTRGSASIFGLDCQSQAVEVKRHVGYVAGEPPQFGAMAGGVDRAYVKQLSERLELDLSRRFREYSTGNKKKLVLVIAFMHRPRLLILDEPTSGLDPLNQQEFYVMVREAQQDGATVFLSSHVLSEVEHICGRVGIIRSGHLVKVASLEDLHRIRMHHVEVEFAGDVPVEAIRRAAGVDGVTAENHRLRCVVRGSFEPLMGALVGAHVVNLTSHEPSLEEAFLAYYSGAEEGVASPC